MNGYYAEIRLLHIVFALLSLSGFILRGVLMLRGSSLLGHPLTRRIPHVNDTLLFVFGLVLLWTGPWSLAAAGWLQLKLALLLVYIGLGFIALHRGRFSKPQRLMAWSSALVIFSAMLWLAHYKPL